MDCKDLEIWIENKSPENVQKAINILKNKNDSNWEHLALREYAKYRVAKIFEDHKIDSIIFGDYGEQEDIYDSDRIIMCDSVSKNILQNEELKPYHIYNFDVRLRKKVGSLLPVYRLSIIYFEIFRGEKCENHRNVYFTVS